MASTVEELIAERTRCGRRANELHEKALAEWRDLNEEEQKEFADCVRKNKELSEAIRRRCVQTVR